MSDVLGKDAVVILEGIIRDIKGGRLKVRSVENKNESRTRLDTSLEVKLDRECSLHLYADIVEGTVDGE